MEWRKRNGVCGWAVGFPPKPVSLSLLLGESQAIFPSPSCRWGGHKTDFQAMQRAELLRQQHDSFVFLFPFHGLKGPRG